MKHFRIITDGSKFRVQKRINFAGLRFWLNEHYYEINDTYPKVISHNVEFDNHKEAKHYVKDQLGKLNVHSRWKVVSKH